MLVCLNVINGEINQYITITLSPAEAGDLNAYFELVPVSRKRYVSEQGFLFKKLSAQSLLQAPEVFNRNFRTPRRSHRKGTITTYVFVVTTAKHCLIQISFKPSNSLTGKVS